MGRRSLEFVPLAGYEGLYEINCEGTIISISIYNQRKPDYLVPIKADNETGELFVRLYKDRTWIKYTMFDLLYENNLSLTHFKED